MVHADDNWRLLGVLVGGMTLGVAAYLMNRRRRRRTLRERLAEELALESTLAHLRERLPKDLDLQSSLENLREVAQDVRERIPLHDGRVARSFWQRRVRPLFAAVARGLPERAQTVAQSERAAVEKLRRDVFPSTERLAREAIRTAEDAIQRTTARARSLPQRLPTPRTRAQRFGLRARVGQTIQEAAAFGFWVSAAGLLVYFGLLRPEQREQLRRGLSSLLTQLRELWLDFSFREEPLAEFSE